MFNKALVVVMVLISINMASAKDFGKQGTTFEVKEEGFVAMMQRKLKDVDLVEHQQKMKDIARKKVEEPEPVEGITKATKTVSYIFDPTYVLDEDVLLPCGKLLYPKGTEVNPLDHITWSGKLVFIDSRDKKQVTWAVENYITDLDSRNENSDKDGNKIILTAGRPLDLEKETGSSIYFDQAGVLTKKFNISHVPAVIEQQGKYLKVTEINIEDKQ